VLQALGAEASAYICALLLGLWGMGAGWREPARGGSAAGAA